MACLLMSELKLRPPKKPTSHKQDPRGTALKLEPALAG